MLRDPLEKSGGSFLFDHSLQNWSNVFMTKKCPRCEQELDVCNFTKSSHTKSGLSCYCKKCDRDRKNLPPRKWISRRDGLEWCKICEKNPRLPYHQYCHDCKMEYQRQTRATKWRERHPDWKARRKSNARAYATGLLQRGKIKRGPCEVCGKPSEHFHHLDYEDRTMNFQHLCRACHNEKEKEKRKIDKLAQASVSAV